MRKIYICTNCEYSEFDNGKINLLCPKCKTVLVEHKLYLSKIGVKA